MVSNGLDMRKAASEQLAASSICCVTTTTTQPRVTELKKEGDVEFAAKRLCAVTGKRVNTIQPSDRGRLLLDHLRRERKN